MRILWLCNKMPAAYARENNMSFSNKEGWIDACYEKITSSKSYKSIHLAVCYPVNITSHAIPNEYNGVKMYPFFEDTTNPHIYNEMLEDDLKKILHDYKPDVIHIFGTEYPHALAMAKAAENKKRLLVGIQGLCASVYEHYFDGLPEDALDFQTFRDKIKKDSIRTQREAFLKRSENERETLLLTGNITGRTNFDKFGTFSVNPEAKYFHINESIRECFYKSERDNDNVVRSSIFMAGGDYPIKGLHTMLEALAILREKYFDVHLYVAGNPITGRPKRKTVTASNYNPHRGIKSFVPAYFKIGSYGKYINDLIEKHNLKNNVTMLGMLNDIQMKEQYLKASVFVCPSFIENSPNCIGEAMLTNTPIVASNVGGIPDIITSGREGLLFEAGDANSLADAISQIWSEPVITSVYVSNANKKALEMHDVSKNIKGLIEAYKLINKGAV